MCFPYDYRWKNEHSLHFTSEKSLLNEKHEWNKNNKNFPEYLDQLNVHQTGPNESFC